MYHAAWKLTALALVVALGAVVVIHAQRGMPEGDAAGETEVASSLGSEGEPNDSMETGSPPAQGEPDVASGRAPVAADPFADADDGQKHAAAETAPRGRSSRPAAPDKNAIDIIDVDDQDEPALGSNKAPNSKKTIQPVAAAKATATRNRGPVLTLDDPAADTEDSDAPTGPQLLGANDAPAGRPARIQTTNDDPFSDDAAAKGKSNRTAVDDDDDRARDEDSPPDVAPKSALEVKPKRLKRDVSEDDEETLDLPGSNSSGPNRSGEEMKRRTEPEPAIDDSESIEGDPFESRRAPERTRSQEPGPIEMQDSLEAETPAPPDVDETIAAQNAVPHKAPLPQLAIEKIAPPTAVLGRPMVYYIQVRNIGALAAHQVVVEDIVPRDVKLDGSIPQAQLKDDRLIWKLGTLAAGHEKKIAVRVVPQAEGTIGSVATVNFLPDANPQANVAAPQLQFDVDAPRKAALGMPVEFKFRVKNVGPVAATGVTIRDVLPAALRHTDGDDIEYLIGQLPAGKTHEVKLILTAAQAGHAVNRAVVTADGNVSEEAHVQLDVVGPELAVVRNGPKRLFPDKTGRFSNTVTNPGSSQMSSATIVEVIPAGLEFVEAADGGTYNAAKRTVTWTINQLGPGESKTVKLTLRSAARGAQISVVRAYDNSGASGETVGTTHVSGVPALTIEMGELPSLVEVGESIKVTVRVLNRGSDLAANVRTKIAVPAGMQFVAAQGPVEHRKVAIVNTAGDQASAKSAEVQFAPIGKIDPRADAVYELTFKARVPGPARVQVEAQCDQLAEPIHREEVTTLVAPQ